MGITVLTNRASVANGQERAKINAFLKCCISVALKAAMTGNRYSMIKIKPASKIVKKYCPSFPALLLSDRKNIMSKINAETISRERIRFQESKSCN